MLFCDANPPNPTWAAHSRATKDQGPDMRHFTDVVGY